MDEFTMFVNEGYPEAEGMQDPVICAYCGKIYDLGTVTVIARYADCSVFKTPCCNKEADDRTFVSMPSFRRCIP